jgi:hypothetical protein
MPPITATPRPSVAVIGLGYIGLRLQPSWPVLERRWSESTSMPMP